MSNPLSFPNRNLASVIHVIPRNRCSYDDFRRVQTKHLLSSVTLRVSIGVLSGYQNDIFQVTPRHAAKIYLIVSQMDIREWWGFPLRPETAGFRWPGPTMQRSREALSKEIRNSQNGVRHLLGFPSHQPRPQPATPKPQSRQHKPQTPDLLRMVEIPFAPKKPWNDDSLASTSKQWFSMPQTPPRPKPQPPQTPELPSPPSKTKLRHREEAATRQIFRGARVLRPEERPPTGRVLFFLGGNSTKPKGNQPTTMLSYESV